MIFKCKNCGGNVVYSPERKKMFCPFCESEDSEERQDGVIYNAERIDASTIQTLSGYYNWTEDAVTLRLK